MGGSTTAEDAVEMTMSEFKDLVKDVGLETKDLRFDVMCNMFIKANALNTNAVREQRINERKSAESKQEGPSDKASKAGPKREKKAASKKDQEMDQELVLYEFVALLGARARRARSAPRRSRCARAAAALRGACGSLETRAAALLL